MHSLWEGSACPHFLFLHLTSFLSQCAQAYTAALVGGITNSISQPNMKEVHSDHAQPTKVATNIHRIVNFMQDAFRAISAKGKINWPSIVEMQ